MLWVSDFLTEKRVCFLPAKLSKQQVIGRLVGLLDLRDPTTALKAVLDREQVETTVIAPGVALPHARLARIDGILVSLGLSVSGAVDAYSGGRPIHVFFLFLSPASQSRQHLNFLVAASHLSHRRGFVQALVKFKTPAAVIDAIRRAEGQDWHPTISLTKIP